MSIHTMICTEHTLNRVHDYTAGHSHSIVRIIHTIWDDLYDRYIVLIECDAPTFTLLMLL